MYKHEHTRTEAPRVCAEDCDENRQCVLWFLHTQVGSGVHKPPMLSVTPIAVYQCYIRF